MNNQDTIINEELLKLIIKTAKQAGEAIMEIYSRDDFGIIKKEDNTPLTLADSASDDVIKQTLSRLTPDIPLLSEESLDVPYENRKKWKRFWLIDPLDGTKEFIKRNGEFTVNIALIEDNEPILGVVYAPASGTLYYGAKDLGAYKLENNSKKRITTQKYKNGEILNIVASHSHHNENTEKFIKNIEQDSILVNIIKIGSSLKFCLVAEGMIHLYPRFGATMEWDTAAAQAIVEAAGGSVTNLDNEPLRYNKEKLLNPYFIVDGSQGFRWQKYL